MEVVSPLIFAHVGVSVSQGVMSFKSLDEFNLHVVGRSVPLDDITVAIGVVELLSIFDGKAATALLSNGGVSLSDHLSSDWGQFASDLGYELVKGHSTVVVLIKTSEKSWHVLLTDSDFEIFAGLEELSLGKST